MFQTIKPIAAHERWADHGDWVCETMLMLYKKVEVDDLSLRDVHIDVLEHEVVEWR